MIVAAETESRVDGGTIITAISVGLAIFFAAQLVRTRKRLADATANQDATLNTANEDDARMRAQAERMRSLGDLAGGIAHDFSNLLVGVVTNAELLQQYHPQTDASNKCIDNILVAADLATRLSRKLQAHASKQTPNKTVNDLNQLTRPIAKLVQSTARPTIVTFNEPPAPVIANVDMQQFEQIVLNLTENAKEAIPETTKGEIWIRTGHEELALYSSDPFLFGAEVRPGTYAFVEVKDNGIGLATTDMIRVFEPMQSTKEGRSRGLGLSIVFSHVKRHDGLIRVKSRSGVDSGSSFRVLFPANTEHDSTSEAS
jgi:two-component system cell cycle sensor histidine kinase/response regulator CckA